jgi:iron complex outermembrane receptor protein
MRRTLGGLAAAALCTPALAQQDAVVVTATRSSQPALEVPASIDRIYGDEIREDRQKVNLSESMGRVPGLAVLNRQNYAQDLQIQSRGFGARSTFGVRGIRLIADGIPATMPDGQGQASTFALGSAERIEVLRGPFSSMYGNASGGVIALDTMDGPPVPTGEAELMVGSYQTHRLGLRFGAQNGIGDVSRFETNGYRDHSITTRDQLNAKLRAGDFTVVANHLDQPDTQDPLGLTRAQVAANPRQATPEALQFNTRKSVSQDQVGATFRRGLGGAGRVEVMGYVGQRGVQQFLAIPLATQAAATHSGGVVDLDRQYGGGALRWARDVGAVRLSAGAEYDAMYERRKGFINNNGAIGALKRDEDNSVASNDFYGQVEWRFAQKWILNAGARHSRVAFESQDYFLSNGDDSGSRVYTATTPVAGLLYRATRNTSVYGNFGRGFETPTFLELAYQNSGSGLNFGLDPSTSRHLEAGVKSVAPNVGRVNVAIFKIATEHEIVVDRNQGGRATFKNVGHTDRKGLEVGAETMLPGRWQARAAYTRLDATFREGFDTVIGVFPNNQPVTVQPGSRLPGTARDQLYADLRYRRAPFHATLEALYRSRVPVNDPNTDYAGSFTVWNLAAGLVQERGRLRFTEFVRIDNLADRDYVGSVIVNETNFRYFEPAPRRNMSVGLQAALQF